jgi:hypothetical protein
MRREGYKADLSSKGNSKARVILQKDRREKFAMAKRYREVNVVQAGVGGVELVPLVNAFVDGRATLENRLDALASIRKKIFSDGEVVIAFLLSPTASSFLPVLMQMVECGEGSEREEALWGISDLATGNMEQTTYLWTPVTSLLHILSSHNTDHLTALIWACKSKPLLEYNLLN